MREKKTKGRECLFQEPGFAAHLILPAAQSHGRGEGSGRRFHILNEAKLGCGPSSLWLQFLYFFHQRGVVVEKSRGRMGKREGKPGRGPEISLFLHLCLNVKQMFPSHPTFPEQEYWGQKILEKACPGSLGPDQCLVHSLCSWSICQRTNTASLTMGEA